MPADEKNFFINNPIFVKYRTRFDVPRWKREKVLKSVFVNERIVEVPFVIQSLAGLPEGSRVLDLGCTESPLPLQLAALGYRVTGFDFREYPYRHPNLDFVRGDLTCLPFEDSRFDAVLSVSTLEHVGIGFYKDPRQAIGADQKAVDEILRVLKPDGLFVLTAPYGKEQVGLHQRIYTEESLKKLLAFFSILKKRYFKNTCLPDSLNTWVEVQAGEAGTIENQERTEGVCLVLARKNAKGAPGSI